MPATGMTARARVRVLSATGAALLSFAYLGTSTALAAGTAPAITSASETYFHTGMPTSFTVTTTGTPAPTISESGALPNGLSLVDNGDGTATLSGTAATGQEGDHLITLTADNGVAPAASQTFTIEVGFPTLVVTSHSFNATEGILTTGQVGSFTGGGGPFTASISWGDGTAPSAGVIVARNVTGSHTFAEEGSTNITLSVTDAAASPSTTAQSTIAQVITDSSLFNPSQASVPIAANEGATFTSQVMTFGDTDPGKLASDYTASINWGDGSTTVGTIVAIAGGLFGVNGTHSYGEHGIFNGTTTVTDNLSAATGLLTATIGEVVPLVVTGKNITATAGVAFSGEIATVQDNGNKEALSDYKVKILWGDGTATDNSGIVADPPGVLTVSGTHTYAAAGTFTITVGAEEADGALFDLGTGTATVAGVLPASLAPRRPLPVGLLLVVLAGLLLVGAGGLTAWRRQPT